MQKWLLIVALVVLAGATVALVGFGDHAVDDFNRGAPDDCVCKQSPCECHG
jgi:hypothetical protein